MNRNEMLVYMPYGDYRDPLIKEQLIRLSLKKWHDIRNMPTIYQDDITAENCALCEAYLEPDCSTCSIPDGKCCNAERCDGCPLSQRYGICDDHTSMNMWHKISEYSWTKNKYMLDLAINVFILQLESLLWKKVIE